ncbi:hypothetical protein PSR25_19455 [Acinetobacter pittii]|uniref:hypothetical protein n=1 Tax=Acinetobacter pittii TaxID=48296 RepID=UPI003088367D|nr:hypothetical protein PSR25_19455 [Acinetobacter pittii]
MSYSIIQNDIVNVDDLIRQIKLYLPKFREHEKFFIHCKNVERFERNLEANVPTLSYKIAEIYAFGRELAMSVPSYIEEYLTIERTGLLKTAIDKLEPNLRYLKSWAESEHEKVLAVYQDCGYNEWSVNHMLSRSHEMYGQIDEILVFINTIKASYSYQIQSGEIAMAEVRDLMRAQMNTINNSGNFHHSQISTGNGSTNTMTINQNKSEELALICQKLIDVIDQSSAEAAEKDAVKTIVYEIKEANTLSSLKDAYNKLTSSMSNHITIGTAILSSSILPALNQLIM